MGKNRGANAGDEVADEEADAQAYKPVPYVEEILVTLFLLEIVALLWCFSWENLVDWDVVGKFLEGNFAEGITAANLQLRVDQTGDDYRVRAFGITFPALTVMLVVIMGAYVEGSKACISAACLRISRTTTKMGMVSSDLFSFQSPLDNPVTMKKFREQGWQLSVHILMSAIEYVLVAKESPNGHLMGPQSDKLAWEHTLPLNAGGAYHQPSNWLVLLYSAQVAIWMYTAFVCWAIDERKKDYLVMMAHHVVTIALILGSAWCNHMGIGLMVLWIHDVSDIFVDGLKMINYLGLDGPNGFFIVETSYLTCLGVWIYARLWVYPTAVLHSSLFGSARWVGTDEQALALGHPTSEDLLPPHSFRGVVDNVRRGTEFVAMYLQLNALLISLQLMHVWWCWLIVRLGFRMIQEGNRNASEKMYEGKKDKIMAARLAAKAKAKEA
jgi:ceramide synthetase